jgi:FkbM family methyltransferase
VDLALNKPALQSSTSRWSRSRIAAEDARGANSGVIPDDYGFHTDTEPQPWWQVDLQQVVAVRRVAILNRRTYTDRLSRFSLLKSLDGQEWSVFFSKTDPVPFGGAGDERYVAEIVGDHGARFVRVRLDGTNPLHFRQCQVFGDLPGAAAPPSPPTPPARDGFLAELDGVSVFVDTANYAAPIVAALRNGTYEARERRLVKALLQPGDRVLEVGTALGIVAMTAASVVGAASVRSFDANPDIAADARENFQRNGLQAIESHVGVLQSRHAAPPLPPSVDFFIDRAFWGSRLNASLADPKIVRVVQVPTRCLEDEIRSFEANVLVCDIEGGEVDLLMQADLSGIRLIVMEIHYWSVGRPRTDALIRRLILEDFALDLMQSGSGIAVLRR